MDPIRLIRDRAELEGTCYFEFLPGKYRGLCWNDESVYLAEDVFGLIEPIIARHVDGFDHYSFVGIRRSTWEWIIADLERLAHQAATAANIGELRGNIGFISAPTEERFASHFRANADALAALARELSAWLRQQLQEHECVSVLGI